MQYVEYQRTLDRPKDGTTLRAIYQRRVEQGKAGAQALLDGPVEYPDELGYLDRWSQQLYGRSGVGPMGLAPLSYQSIKAWSEVTGNVPSPQEVEALLVLDAIRSTPYPSENEPPKQKEVA